MAAQSIGYPLPVLINGYPCLNGNEIELAKKHIDPARPQADPRTDEARKDEKPFDPEKVDGARQAAESKTEKVIAYSPDAVRTVTSPTGTVMSVEA